MRHEGTRLGSSKRHFVLLPFCLHRIVSCYGMTSTEAGDEIVITVGAIPEHFHVRHD
jgi:hypothetical protein